MNRLPSIPRVSIVVRPVIQCIDAGWDFDPGAACLRGLAEKAIDSHVAAHARGIFGCCRFAG
jgi:hypothetical protein